MSHHVGIDLGTTNSVICTYDGQSVRLLKSPDQNDVTPSAIYVDPRGNRLFGKRAYDNAARDPERAAILFKRFMGTSTPMQLPAANLDLTPEECSAEILKVLFGYLPEEVRQDAELGTVITVPAAFNQMQKEATLAAAELAGIGRVALLQEPVAAVMAIMRQRKADGRFLVFDFGGGTLDVAVAHSVSGRVSLLSHGGVAMCGGRDFDRLLMTHVVIPWLKERFALPQDVAVAARYRRLLRTAAWAAEKAKIELSARTESVIALAEYETGARDEKDAEIYLDIPLHRGQLDRLIADPVDEAIRATREAIEKAGLDPADLDHIVFVGGPTQYPPLREKVASSLGIAASTEVNPMTAVAEGAALFAESIDWSSTTRSRKSARGTVATGGLAAVTLNFASRTPDSRARVSLQRPASAGTGSEGALEGATFEINSLDTGWSSGRALLTDGASIEVPLALGGDNAFKIFVFDGAGRPLAVAEPRFVIARTAASVDAIPSSSSLGFEVEDPRSRRPVISYLVREGDRLPAKGTMRFIASTTVRAGGTDALRFKLWEGEIEDPITHNRLIGELVISGRHLQDLAIQKGAELLCHYEVLDSGNVRLEVSVPSIGQTFSGEDGLYSRQLAQVDFLTAAAQVQEEARIALRGIALLTKKIVDPRLTQISALLEQAARVDGSDKEETKRASDQVLEAKRLLARVSRDHLPAMRRSRLDWGLKYFNSRVRPHAHPAECAEADSLAQTAHRSIESGAADFEVVLDELWGRSHEILWRQDFYIVEQFNLLTASSARYVDKAAYEDLVRRGREAIGRGDLQGLRGLVNALYRARLWIAGDEHLLAASNLIGTS
jgi:molecular chaperone DnaK